MKKITFILLALISGNAFAQNTATTEAFVYAEIVSPLTITNIDQNLSFGTIASIPDEDGKVRIDLNGARTFSNPRMNVPSSITTPSAAEYKINAADEYTYRISIPSITLTGSDGTMDLDLFYNEDELGTGTGLDQNLYVGGLLSVSANQSPGVYEGTATITVTYE